MEKLEFKGTAGKWSLSRATLSRYEIIKPDHKWKGYDKLISSVAVETEMEDDYNEDVANAHLIAASKDLLEACIEAVEYLDNVDAISINTISSTSILHNKMKAAITKALNTTSNE